MSDYIIIGEFITIICLFIMINKLIKYPVMLKTLLDKVEKLTETVYNLEEAKKQINIKPFSDKWAIGLKCLHITTLIHNKGDNDETTFEVELSCTVQNISETKLLITIDDVYFFDNNIIGKKITKANVISFMDNTWITKSKCDLIMDETYNRIITLNNLINNE